MVDNHGQSIAIVYRWIVRFDSGRTQAPFLGVASKSRQNVTGILICLCLTFGSSKVKKDG